MPSTKDGINVQCLVNQLWARKHLHFALPSSLSILEQWFYHIPFFLLHSRWEKKIWTGPALTFSRELMWKGKENSCRECLFFEEWNDGFCPALASQVWAQTKREKLWAAELEAAQPRLSWNSTKPGSGGSLWLCLSVPRELVSRLHQRGVQVFLVSGGFQSIVEHVALQLNIPTANVFANRLKFYFNGESPLQTPPSADQWHFPASRSQILGCRHCPVPIHGGKVQNLTKNQLRVCSL